MIPSSTEILNFLELFKTRHLSHAAIRLGVTQPTLSQSLQRLEEKVGSQLFFRTKRGLIPTDFGNEFYLRAKTLLDAWDGLIHQPKNGSLGLEGRFRLGCHSAVAGYTVPRLLKRLNAEAPRIELELVHDISRKITEKLLSFELHFAFVVNPVRHGDLVLVKLGEDRVTFWKRRAAKSVPERLILDTNLAQVDDLLRKTRSKVFPEWSMINTGSLELTRTLIAEGGGVGVLPERVALADGAELEVFDSSLPVFRDEIFLAYRKEMILTASGKKVIEWAKGVLVTPKTKGA